MIYIYTKKDGPEKKMLEIPWSFNGKWLQYGGFNMVGFECGFRTTSISGSSYASYVRSLAWPIQIPAMRGIPIQPPAMINLPNSPELWNHDESWLMLGKSSPGFCGHKQVSGLLWFTHSAGVKNVDFPAIWASKMWPVVSIQLHGDSGGSSQETINGGVRMHFTIDLDDVLIKT